MNLQYFPHLFSLKSNTLFAAVYEWKKQIFWPNDGHW